MDAKTAWAHDAFFDYVDRWFAGDVEDGGGASNDFVATMWSTYRGAPPTVTACP
ncbi:hypothetical protein OV079_21055 [Nannocystis pusilla]|uniref:Uncharacterized protein n=1 Tax=Nannocystis pusilla TaxID=889268 RepID=A0A9X3EQ75_9BACT|nr:hypothetical protein [Nannocystis pusilla]